MGGDEPAEKAEGFQESFSACEKYGEAGMGGLMGYGCWLGNCAGWSLVRRLRQRRTVRTTRAATRAPPPTPAPIPVSYTHLTLPTKRIV